MCGRFTNNAKPEQLEKEFKVGRLNPQIFRPRYSIVKRRHESISFQNNYSARHNLLENIGGQSQKPAREQGCRNREILNSFVFNYKVKIMGAVYCEIHSSGGGVLCCKRIDLFIRRVNARKHKKPT
jgi:hypothetical protein